MIEHEHIKGLVAPPHTPMHADGSIDLDRIERQAALLAANGVVGAFVCGSTGEGPSLSTRERKAVAQRWVEVARPALRVIVHVGHNSLVEATDLVTHAAEIGADAVATVPPFYYGCDVDAVARFLRELASAAPQLPLYYYHIPVRTGVTWKVYDVLSAARDVANLVGAKFTFEDLMDFNRCVRLEGGRFNMLFGRDEILLAGLAMGANGAVGSTYNFAAPLYRRILDAFAAGDLAAARADQARAVDMIAVLHAFGGGGASKAIMKMIGLDCGPVRSPLAELSESQYRQFRLRLEEIGFFDYCCKLP